MIEDSFFKEDNFFKALTQSIKAMEENDVEIKFTPKVSRFNLEALQVTTAKRVPKNGYLSINSFSL